MLPENLTFVDIETTGGSLKTDRIIEIGVVKTRKNKIIKTFSSLIDPGTHLPDYISSLTGITVNQLEKAPSFYDICDQIFELLEDSVFVAHNVNFDYAFLKSEFKRLGYKLNSKRLCTVRLSRFLYPSFRRHNLDELISRHGISCESRHRALGDAKVTWEFFKKVTKEFPEDKLTKAVKFSSSETSLPNNVNASLLRNLPSSPGVYIFYGSSDIPLYIGKSNNIKQRVKSHFYESTEMTGELTLAMQTERIDTISTAGDLGAMLKESELIKKLKPLHNKRLRCIQTYVWLEKVSSKGGYFTVKIHKDGKQLGEISDVMGVFKSEKEARKELEQICEKHMLCKNLMGIGLSKKTCFEYHIGKCKGACIGKEKSVAYNLRFIEAFYNHKIKPWPFNGPIEIQESDSEGKEETFQINNWSLGERFDVEVYKILKNYFLNPNNFKKVKKIPLNLEQDFC